MGNGKIASTEKPLRGRPKRVGLTEVERQLIVKIAKEGFQTYQEISSTVLNGYHRVSIWRLMKQLVRSGYLFETKSDTGGIAGWTLNYKKVSKLHVASDDSFSGSTKSPVYRTSFAHDLALREIRTTISKAQAIQDWIPEHVLRAEVMRRCQFLHRSDRGEKLLTVPDALLRLKSGGEESKAALELEITQKSKRRIYQKLEAYCISKDFDYAFFIIANANLLRVFWDVYKDVLAKSTRVRIAKVQNGIYFAGLDQIKQRGVDAKFIGLKDTLTFAELST